MRRESVDLAIAQEDLRLFRLAQSPRRFDERLSTDLISNVERLITLSTSAMAVCCWSASATSSVRACNSSNSRTFSIAITAWSAKVSTSSICLSVKGLTSTR